MCLIEHSLLVHINKTYSKVGGSRIRFTSLFFIKPKDGISRVEDVTYLALLANFGQKSGKHSLFFVQGKKGSSNVRGRYIVGGQWGSLSAVGFIPGFCIFG